MDVVIVRHGQSSANLAGILAGRTPGIGLTPEGREDVLSNAGLLAPDVPTLCVSSPLLRCEQTAHILTRALGITRQKVEPLLTEVDYGKWTGKSLHQLSREPLWKTVSESPEDVYFPGGEALPHVWDRAVRAFTQASAQATAMGCARVLVVTHGDIAKMLVAYSLGMRLNQFQALAIATGSISVVRHTPQACVPFLVTTVGATRAPIRSLVQQPGGCA